MREPLQRFTELAAAARRERVPPIEAAPCVLAKIRRIEAGRELRDVNNWLWAFCGASALAASILVVVALEAWETMNHPLAGVFNCLTMVLE